MAFIDPFKRVKSLGNFGYLRVNVKNFLELENRPEEFYNAISDLRDIREGLIVAQQGGLGSSLAEGMVHYQTAIEWLKLNNPINVGIAVSAISSYDDINDSVASSFAQFVQWFKTNFLTNQQIYQNIQIQLGSQKLDQLKNLEAKTDSLAEDFRHSLHEAQTQLAESTDAKIKEQSANLTDVFNKQVQAVADSKREAIESIEQAQSLSIWHEAYEHNIKLYKKKLDGIDWVPLEWRNRLQRNFWLRFKKNFRTWKSINFSHTSWKKFDMRASVKELKFIGYTIHRTIRFMWQAIPRIIYYISSKTILSARGQRTLWFIVLGTVLIGQSLVFLDLLLNNQLEDFPFSSLTENLSLDNLVSNEFIFAKISIFIGIILMPSLGYAFANRNYRIYSNLLEQYRHRATVAQTLQGVLRNIDENENNKDIRMSLTTVAAVAMFEMKNVGHLTKRDGDTLPASEVLQAVMRK